MIKIIINFTYLFVILFVTSSCSGKLFTKEKLDETYKDAVSDMEIKIYYNKLPTAFPIAVKNVGSTFMTNLNLSVECKNTEKTTTQLKSIGNLKPYFFKEYVIPIAYDKCEKIIIKYIFYPDIGGDFTYASKHTGFYIPSEPSVPVEGSLKVK